MANRNIIVIGASAGGFQAIKSLVAQLPADLNASIFIVWHMAANIQGVLPDVLHRLGRMPCSSAEDNEEIKANHIYVAVPDRHMVLVEDRIRVTRGPKENRFRPAIDPLFRSAGFHFGTRVIGVILTGALDDGTSGLWTIKERGGVTVVQDPNDAEVSSMPSSAIRNVKCDYVLPVERMGELLFKLVNEDVEEIQQKPEGEMDKNEQRMKLEIDTSLQADSIKRGVINIGKPTSFTCPECHGVLSSLVEGSLERFRCHTGHSFSSDSLLSAITENIEDSLWNSIRVVKESVLLLNHMGDHFAEINQPKIAAAYFQKAKDAEARGLMIRESVLNHERLSDESIRREAL